jgi:hypothetical protein
MKKNKLKLIVPAFVWGVFCVFSVLGNADEGDNTSSLPLQEQANSTGYQNPQEDPGQAVNGETPDPPGPVETDTPAAQEGEESKNQDEEKTVNLEPLPVNKPIEALTNPEAALYQNLSNEQELDKILLKMTILIITAASIIVIFVLALFFYAVRFKERFRKLDEKIKNIEDSFDRKLRNSATRKDVLVAQPAVSDNSKQLRDLEYRLNVLENSFRKQKAEEVKTQKDQAAIISGMTDPVAAYNNWAANPIFPLPQTFYYLKGEMRIRTAQPIVESPSETKWITNRHGDKQYLFPNPNSFDQMTDISELYKMEMDMLKPRGKNKIKIINPCKMSNTGFINYPGELNIL